MKSVTNTSQGDCFCLSLVLWIRPFAWCDPTSSLCPRSRVTGQFLWLLAPHPPPLTLPTSSVKIGMRLTTFEQPSETSVRWDTSTKEVPFWMISPNSKCFPFSKSQTEATDGNSGGEDVCASTKSCFTHQLDFIGERYYYLPWKVHTHDGCFAREN